MSTLDETQLLQIQVDMAKAFRLINGLELDQFIKQLNSSLAFTPIFDPTLYLKKHKDGGRWARTARAFQELRDKILAEFKEGI